MDNMDNSDSFEELFDSIADRFDESFSDGWERLSQAVKTIYDRTTDKFEEELSLPVAQIYVNDALQKFVTDNVKAILELRVEIHDDWFRLYCTIDVGGIYAEVASNFSLVHVQLDRNVQRFVLDSWLIPMSLIYAANHLSNAKGLNCLFGFIIACSKKTR